MGKAAPPSSGAAAGSHAASSCRGNSCLGHVTRASQPAAAPETSNAASAAQHSRGVRRRRRGGGRRSLRRRRRRRLSAPSRPLPLGVPRAPVSGLSSAILPEAWSKVGRRSEVSSAPDQSARPRDPGRTAFRAWRVSARLPQPEGSPGARGSHQRTPLLGAQATWFCAHECSTK